MISRLASPSVCVIDDDKGEYRPILDALLHLGIGCLHVHGYDSEILPKQPFKGLRVVFADLHLAAPTGKGAASHTAKVFIQVVSPETAPVVVVIWSKYASDKIVEEGLPPEDQPTEADCFKNTLLEAEPRFKDRLIFLEMAKPKPADRPDETKWVEDLQIQIQETFKGLPAFDILWSWEALVRNAGIAVSEGLTTIASLSISDEEGNSNSNKTIHDNLKIILRLLAKEQGRPDCSTATAPRHLATVLAQYLTDQLEHSDGLTSLSQHGDWLSDAGEIPTRKVFAPQINGLLLTAAHSPESSPFLPGTIYQLTDLEKFEELFGAKVGKLINQCYKKLDNGNGWSRENWKEKAKTIFVEISPACDVAQGNRQNALLLAGLILPTAAHQNAKNNGAYQILPSFLLRWPMDDFKEDNVFLVFCGWYKLTLMSEKEPDWIRPWFRLRELPTASLRNWHSSHASRVGFVSLD